jgi:hypothetical protein
MKIRHPLAEKWTNWELWPFWLRYLLITPFWLWYCLRSGSWWFFSSSNPTITFGGFEGEGKKEMYELLPLSSYPRTCYIDPSITEAVLLETVRREGFSYPFIVKPDVGMKGLLFRKIDTEAALLQYHAAIPMLYLIQELVSYPLEVSVFYYRYPNREKGVVSGFIQKDLLQVEGNGKDTLLQLIRNHPKARHREAEMAVKHGERLNEVLPAGQVFPLVYAANLNRGATFTNLEAEIDEPLLEVFDRLSAPAQFYYGRYDIKCASIEALKRGADFSILEFNGAGAEPNHVYQSGYSLLKASREILRHWRVLFEISRINHRRGIRYWSFVRGWRFLREAKLHLRKLEYFEKEIPA